MAKRTLVLAGMIATCTLLIVSNPAPPNEAEPYLGRWALSLPGGAGWLGVRQEEGYLDTVLDIRLAGKAFLTGVSPVGKLISPLDKRDINVGVERFNLYDEFGNIHTLS